FQQALESTGKQLDDIRAYVDDHPELKKPFYKVPHKKGVTGTAANFVLHVSDLMDKRRPLFKASHARSAQPSTAAVRVRHAVTDSRRHGRRVHDGESRRDRSGNGSDDLVRLSAARNEAAGKDARISGPPRSRPRHQR